MENTLEKINQSTLKILTSQSLAEMCKTIVEEARNLVHAQQGIIYLHQDERLKLAYASSENLQKIKNINKEYLQRIFNQEEITILTGENLKKIDSSTIQSEINTIIVIPLLYYR